MKRTRTTFGFLFLAVLLIFIFFRPSSRWKAGEGVSKFSLHTEEGEKVSLSDFSGKIVLINFWATWCPPCIEEMPSLVALQKRFAGRPFVLLTVNEDEGGSDVLVRQFKKQTGLDFLSLLDETGSIADAFGVYSLPQSFLIDGQGQLIRQISGAVNWSGRKYVELIESHLEK